MCLEYSVTAFGVQKTTIHYDISKIIRECLPAYYVLDRHEIVAKKRSELMCSLVDYIISAGIINKMNALNNTLDHLGFKNDNHL